MLVSQLFSSPENTGKDQAVQTVMSGRTEDKSGQKSAPVFKASKDGSAKTTIDDYERDYENQLKEILETIIGVEDVSIVVNVDATSLKVFEKNKTKKDTTTEETDKEGGKRSVTDQTSEEQIVMIRNGDQETPVVVQTKKARYPRCTRCRSGSGQRSNKKKPSLMPSQGCLMFRATV